MSRFRLAAATMAIAALGFTQGCAARAYPRPKVLPAGTDIAITSPPTSPLLVHFGVLDGQFPRAACRATRIGGYSTGRTGDTVRFAWIASVTPLAAGDSTCAIGETARVSITPMADIRVHNNLSRLQVSIILAAGMAGIVLLVIRGREAVSVGP